MKYPGISKQHSLWVGVRNDAIKVSTRGGVEKKRLRSVLVNSGTESKSHFSSPSRMRIRGIVISPQGCVPENVRLMDRFQKLTSMAKLATKMFRLLISENKIPFSLLGRKKTVHCKRNLDSLVTRASARVNKT